MMSKENIVVIGASGHAKVVMDVIEREGHFHILGWVDTFKPAGEVIFGYRVLGGEDSLPALMKNEGVAGGLIAIGDNWKRHLMAERIRTLAPNFDFIRAVHPSAQIGRGATIGRGAVVMAGAVVNSDSAVGEFCIVNTKASLDHDSVMEDFSSLAPNAATGGNVRVGAFSAISLGANVLHGRTIGAHSVIGAGALVLDDIPDHCVVYGAPARVVRKRAEGESYL